MKSNVTVDDMSVIRWWVDASHTVHEDCRIHIAGCMMLREGMPVTMSKKQKLNRKSSTEFKLIAMDDKLPQVLWIHYFLEKQGCEIKKHVVYQDNKSTILLKMMARDPVPNAPHTSRLDIFSSRIKWTASKYQLNTVQPRKCGQTSSPSQNKDFHNGSFGQS